MTLLQHLAAASTHPLVLAVLALAATHALARRSPLAALRFSAALVLAWVVAHALKLLVGDPRPPHAGIVSAWGSGWPSGHAAVGAAAAVAGWREFALRLTRGRRILLGALLATAAVGLAASRVYLGVHDAGDVLGGLAVGAAAASLLRARAR